MVSYNYFFFDIFQVKFRVVPESDGPPQEDEEEPGWVEEVLRRDPQHELQVEGVQLWQVNIKGQTEMYIV